MAGKKSKASEETEAEKMQAAQSEADKAKADAEKASAEASMAATKAEKKEVVAETGGAISGLTEQEVAEAQAAEQE